MDKPPQRTPTILEDMVDLFMENMYLEITKWNRGQIIGSFVEYLKTIDFLNGIDIARIITGCVYAVYEEEDDEELRYLIIEAFLNAIRIGNYPMFLYPDTFKDNEISGLIEDFKISREVF